MSTSSACAGEAKSAREDSLDPDRDPVFTEAWTALLETGGVAYVPIPAQSPKRRPGAGRPTLVETATLFGPTRPSDNYGPDA